FEIASAGTVVRDVHPLAVQVMAELGIDISAQRAKTVDEVGEAWDVVVTVCDASCPIPPRATLQLRWRFADPALARGDEAERRRAFRQVRDRIRERVLVLAARLDRGRGA